MVKHDFELHQGQDFRIIYEVPSDSDMTLNGFQGVCKIRKRHDEAVIFELQPTIEDKRITFTLLGKESARKQLISQNLVYDAFIYNDTNSIKVGIGKITLIPDISMHE